jgi:hypothetical protein
MPKDMDRRFEDPPSLSASLADHLDFDPDRDRSPFFGIPSTHSGFRSELSADSEPESDSAGPWSPPAWHKSGSGWLRHHIPSSRSISRTRSRDPSPQYESAGEGDITIPANIPLPVSPAKGSPRNSPERDAMEGDEDKQIMETPTPPMQTPAQSPEPEVPNNCTLARWRQMTL